MGPRQLLVDVGNSRLKWALACDSALTVGNAIEHHGDPAAAFARIDAGAVDAVWIADVTGGSLRAALLQAVRTCCRLEPHFAVSESSRAGLICAYARPQRLGVDRWLMLLAAWTRMHAAVCVVSAGTALTFDAIDSHGRHLGGVIAPGLRAMQQAVLGTTRFDADGPRQDYDDGLGADTEACVRQGALHAAAGLIERLASHYGGNAACWLSGGDADALLPHLPQVWVPHPDLVLEGLLALAMDHATA